MKTSEEALELALYSNECCHQELIFDVGDTVCRCPKCQRLCEWSLESKISDLAAAESDGYIPALNGTPSESRSNTLRRSMTYTSAA
jgi:hypothetical protein